jgi:hypothetical protein
MPVRSVVELPPTVGEAFDVFVNGVPQQPGVDYTRQGRSLVFDRALRRDKVSGWRWFLGAWGVGTYRQDDAVDIRYESAGAPRVAHRLEITLLED